VGMRKSQKEPATSRLWCEGYSISDPPLTRWVCAKIWRVPMPPPAI